MFITLLVACLGISGMKENEGYWGGGISIISQNFPKSHSILFHPLDSSVSQTSPNAAVIPQGIIRKFQKSFVNYKNLTFK
jgi:hypothetical protein